uniref:SIS domain-containing protein n=2 Tax=Bacillati TaxID=1783272 RepID=UPI001C3DE875
LVVAISQSGETMDTLMAVRHAREQGAKVIALCNTRGSTIPRESDAALYLHVGPEIAVASTKAYLGQIVASYLLGLFLAQVRGNLFPDEIAALMEDLEQIPAQIQQVLDSSAQVEQLAKDMKDVTSV